MLADSCSLFVCLLACCVGLGWVDHAWLLRRSSQVGVVGGVGVYGCLYLLLATFVTSSLDARLSLLVMIAMVIVVAAARAALVVGGNACAALPLGGSVTVPGARRAGWTVRRGPAGDHVGTVHAAADEGVLI